MMNKLEDKEEKREKERDGYAESWRMQSYSNGVFGSISTLSLHSYILRESLFSKWFLHSDSRTWIPGVFRYPLFDIFSCPILTNTIIIFFM